MHPLMPHDWRNALVRSTVLLLLIAGVARLAYELIGPLMPILAVGLGLVAVYWVIRQRFGR